MYKQLIIARQDLNMSTGKLAAQVAHASMVFLITQIKEKAKAVCSLEYSVNAPIDKIYTASLIFDKGTYEDWIQGSFTKIVCGARNKNHIMKSIKMAKELGMREGIDYFLIRDNCLTELQPEDEDGRTLTCIGFRPMEGEIIEKISRKYNLYH